MIWKQYKNELIVAMSLLLLIVALGYKNAQLSARTENIFNMKHSVSEFQELIVLKKRWGDKKISTRVDKLKKIVPASKLKWQKKTKKVTASYQGISAKELNKVITTILNLAVQIDLLEIKNNNGSYTVEFKCKW